MGDVAIRILRQDTTQLDGGKVDVRTRCEISISLDTEVACVFVGRFFSTVEDAELLPQKVRLEPERHEFVGVRQPLGRNVGTDGGNAGSDVGGMKFKRAPLPSSHPRTLDELAVGESVV